MTLVVFIKRNQGSEISQIGLDLNAWDRKTENNNDLNRKERDIVLAPKLLLSCCSPILSIGFHSMAQDGCLSFSHPLHIPASTKQEGLKKVHLLPSMTLSGSCTHTTFPYKLLAKT